MDGVVEGVTLIARSYFSNSVAASGVLADVRTRSMRPIMSPYVIPAQRTISISVKWWFFVLLDVAVNRDFRT